VTESKILINDFRVSRIFGFPEPYPREDLRQKLLASGFQIVPEKERVVEVPNKLRAERVDFASKGNATVLYDYEVGLIGTAGRGTKEVVSIMRTLDEILIELDRAPIKNARSAEALLVCRAWTKNDPSESIMRFSDCIKLDSLARLLGSDARCFSLRIAPKKFGPNLRTTLDWFDLRIEPLIVNSRYYYLSLVYRKPLLEEVMLFCEKIEETVLRVLETMEHPA